MKKIVLDTNVLISFVTDRNQAQQEKAAEILVQAAEGASILCQQEVISEFVYVLDSVYQVNKQEIRQILLDFVNMPGVEIVAGLDFDLIAKLWPERIADYGDAVIAAVCKNTGNAVVATFGRKFAKELAAIGLTVLD